MDTSSTRLVHFWATPLTELYSLLHTSPKGVSHAGSVQRLRLYGPNELKMKKQYNLFLHIFKKLTNPLILILIFSSTISAFLGQIPELVIILVILFVSILIDSLQEHKANKAADDLRAHVQVTTSVLRDGEYKELPLSKIVPGDIVSLHVGDIVPADCRIVSSETLMVSQSALTGESYPSSKAASDAIHMGTELPKQDNSLFMGTYVVSGSAIALVVRTGLRTQYGQLAVQLTKKRPETDFEIGTRKFGSMISTFTFILVIIAFLVNSFLKHSLLESFLFSLAIAIGMTPELLPVIISINLARGGQRMAKKSVIVKELPAIEIFGSMDVLCTDKTGTLTQDEIRLERYENARNEEDENVLKLGVVHSLFQSGITNPIETAILAHKSASHAKYIKLSELPFDFTRKLSSVIVEHNQSISLITKGAPEVLLHACTHLEGDAGIQVLTTAKRSTLVARFEELSRDGFRVLALAKKEIRKKDAYTLEDESELVFVGFMSFLDPPKNGAHEALLALEKQGVTVKILTGDNEIVTQKVCQELHLPVLGTIVGKDMEKLSEKELCVLVENTTIFARLTPNQKERVILALKENGHVVGFMGDGMNDATSLRASDVGISVNNAIDAAKESADIILMHKSLRVLHDGVMEGRRTYRNIMKYILMGTSSNLGNMVSVAGASLFLPFLPMLPVQILLNDLLYDMSELVIPSDNVDPESIELPRKWDVSFIKKFTLVFGPLSSLFDFATFGVLLFFKAPAPLFQTVWFVESICSQVLIIFVIRTRRVPFFTSNPSTLLVVSSLSVVFFALLLPLTPLASLFGFARPPLAMYGAIIGIVCLYVLFVETIKKVFYAKISSTIFTPKS